MISIRWPRKHLEVDHLMSKTQIEHVYISSEINGETKFWILKLYETKLWSIYFIKTKTKTKTKKPKRKPKRKPKSFLEMANSGTLPVIFNNRAVYHSKDLNEFFRMMYSKNVLKRGNNVYLVQQGDLKKNLGQLPVRRTVRWRKSNKNPF